MTCPKDWLVQLSPRLRMQARMMHLDPRLKTRFGSSDLVEETLLKAHKNIAQCRAANPVEMLGWLQEILRNQLRDMVEHEHAQIRDLNREKSLTDLLAESSARLDSVLAGAVPSPSEEVAHQHFLVRLAAVLDASLERLPAAQRDAIILYKLQGLAITEIAGRLRRSEKAVRDLVCRAVRRLRKMPELQQLLEELP